MAAAKKSAAKAQPVPMEAPKSGVRIRMYRHGHGDCYLLAMPGEKGKPYYFLIDCGAKPDSEINASIEETIRDIIDATGGFIDAVLITHEHQDHVNMFIGKLNKEIMFGEVKFGEVMLGWTANPKDKLAQKLRAKKAEAVKKLLAARKGLAGMSRDDEQEAVLAFVDRMLEYEDAEHVAGFAAAKKKKKKKLIDSKVQLRGLGTQKAVDYVASRVTKPRYLMPHDKPERFEGVDDIEFFVLGPPRSDLIDIGEPKKSDKPGQARLYEKTAKKHGLGFDFGFGAALDGLFAAADPEAFGDAAENYRPFMKEVQIPFDALKAAHPHKTFFNYFLKNDDNWRSADGAWLMAAAWFADKLNTELNNSSVVLAIRLEKTGKVLLFPGDAQYGNWMSWNLKTIKDGANTVTTEDLLARTVFYKVGHHGSHNATLKGTAESDYPNLDWMGQGDYADEFAAVIPANAKWAMDEGPNWEHPLKAIRKALEEKTAGRLFQSDTDFNPKRPKDVTAADWKRFTSRVVATPLYFEYTILDA